MNRKRVLIIAIIAILLVLSVGGGFFLVKSANGKEISNKDISTNIDRITIRIINTQRNYSGTSYTLELKNASRYLIKQNSVYLSYPIIQGESRQTNKCKIEATGNKIDIKPNEEVPLNVFIPCEDYKDNTKIDSNQPQFEIEGYLNEISTLTHFGKSGDLIK
jgi:hypothetical protein